MEIFSSLLSLCEGNPHVTGEFHQKGPSNEELRSTPEQTVEKTVQFWGIWDAMAVIWHHSLREMEMFFRPLETRFDLKMALSAFWTTSSFHLITHFTLMKVSRVKNATQSVNKGGHGTLYFIWNTGHLWDCMVFFFQYVCNTVMVMQYDEQTLQQMFVTIISLASLSESNLTEILYKYLCMADCLVSHNYMFIHIYIWYMLCLSHFRFQGRFG